ncbi:cytochrome c1 [Varunaivibrio sulfuroxidans]|uniref:Cytochrome c1 n=1 Tax=Varunaivibrio sulfuroxidans TaxID=1773489 RepID=A0A4R3J7N1_9PROT|nr:cytochrome c1 [Varunaivibrio sulfuroxidans]TCS60913.1 ubiquinol-cytochrome c reductase cytochrome c1 subunit [Varunaivibrio sulfuroxidans]WES31679.1 cytochrome c1 [Varunaivibrio sulfuroxidans]
MRKLIFGAVAAMAIASGGFASGTALASEGGVDFPQENWSFKGIFGKFDRPALRRGAQVYLEVCSNCHSLSLLSYRNLEQIGFSKAEVKKIAAGFDVQDGPNDEGDMYTRPARPSDKFVAPFANEKAARAANNGAFPPDLSVIVKARKGGVDYIHALLTGFRDPPADFKLKDGMQYNLYFPGHQIGMPPPLDADSVEYADGTKATLEQESRDVTTFLAWAAEPELEARKRLGIKVMIYLFVLTSMLYVLKKRIWKRVCLDGSDQENPPA